MEKCGICGLEFADVRKLRIHTTRKHKKTITKPVLFTMQLNPEDSIRWNERADLHKMPLSKYLRHLVDRDSTGKSPVDLENELVQKQREIEKLKADLETVRTSLPIVMEKQMRDFSDRILKTLPQRKVDKKILKISKDFIESRKTKYQKQIESTLEKDPALANKLEEFRLNDPSFQDKINWMEKQVMSNHLIEAEWTSLEEDKVKRAKEIMQSMNLSLVQAIKIVKRKCSPEFETFFKKEWKGLEK